MIDSTVFDGVKINIIIVVFSCIVPIFLGAILTFLAKKDKAYARPIKAFGFIFESISPIALIAVLYFCVFTQYRWLPCILGFTVAFLGYMPSKVRIDYSIAKNIAVNTVGLLAHAFQWSLCVLVFGLEDLMYTLWKIKNLTYKADGLWTGLAVSFVIMLFLRIVQFILEEYMENSKKTQKNNFTD